MAYILAIDDDPGFLQFMKLFLRDAGYEYGVAASGVKALRMIRDRRPDLILLDMVMPQMDGLKFLDKLTSIERCDEIPVIAVSGLVRRDVIIEAGLRGISSYILKKGSINDLLLQRIESHLSASEANRQEAETAADVKRRVELGENVNDPTERLKKMKPLLTRSEINDTIAACGELKAMSACVADVLKVTRSAGGSTGDVAKAIRRDQAIAIKILKMANSSIYSRGDQVDSVEAAVSRIGLEKIQQVVLGISVVDSFAEAEGFDLGAFWDHSIAVGLIATDIFRRVGSEDPDNAFTMGLVHDVGRIIFLQQFGEKYHEVQRVADELRLPLEQVESRLLLMSHADGMDRLLHAWSFPRSLIDPIVFHHSSMGNIRRMAARRVTEVASLALANRLAHALFLGSSGNDVLYPISEYCQALQIDGAFLDRMAEQIPDQVRELRVSLISGSGCAAWSDYREKIVSQFDAPLRPLFISQDAEIDGYRIACKTLSTVGELPPNAIVAHLKSKRCVSSVSSEIATVTMAEELPALPIILLSPTGDIDLEDRIAKKHPIRSLKTPVSVCRLLLAANELLSDERAQAA